MNTPSVRVSYIISTKDRAKHLAEALRNVREFITPADELVIVDGGSTDDTAKVVEANRDIVSMFISESDKGEAHGFNKGILASRGRFIKFITDDDYIYPQAMRDAVALMESHPEVDALVCGGENYDLDPNTGQTHLIGYYYLPKDCRVAADIETTLMYVGCGVGLLLARKAISLAGLLDTTFRAVDVEYFGRLIACKADLRYAHLKLYRHTRYPHSGDRVDSEMRRDHVRVFLRGRRWDLIGYQHWYHLGDATGLLNLPRGDSLSKLIFYGECLRRSPLRGLLRAMTRAVWLPYRLARWLSLRVASYPSPRKNLTEAEIGYDGSLR
jgi:glycosyltransferase involved in cell wall biosynthesis